MIDRTAESERAALEDMLASEGWGIYMEHVAKAWGAVACEDAMRKARGSVSPEEWPFESSRILDTFAGIRADLRWPEERVRALKQAPKKSADDGIASAFGRFRRGPGVATR